MDCRDLDHGTKTPKGLQQGSEIIIFRITNNAGFQVAGLNFRRLQSCEEVGYSMGSRWVYAGSR